MIDIEDTDTDNLPVDTSRKAPAVSALEQAAIAEIQVGAMIALRNPRNEDQARDAILRACKRHSFAEMSRFSIRNKGQGFTVRFSEEACRLWGNIKMQRFIILDDESTVICKVSGWDLQTGTSYSEDVRVPKIVERKAAGDREVLGKRKNSNDEVVYICRATEEETGFAMRSACAKVERNIGLKLIPADVREDARMQIEKTNRGNVETDPETAKRKVLDNFSALGIRPIALQSYLGHDLDTMTPAEVVELREVYASIRSGEVTWHDVMEAREAEAESPPKPSRRARVVATGKGAVRPDVDPEREKKFSELSERVALIAKGRGEPSHKVFQSLFATIEGDPSTEITVEQIEQMLALAESMICGGEEP